jgi:ribosomal protein L37AE/L43A
MKFLFSSLKIILVIAIAFSVGLLMTRYLEPNDMLNAFLLRILTLIAIGLFTGLTSRIFFRRRQLFLRILCALLMGVLGLLILDYFFKNPYGIVLVSFISLVPNEIRAPEVNEISQMVIIAVLGLTTALVGKVKKRIKKLPSQPRSSAYKSRTKSTRAKTKTAKQHIQALKNTLKITSVSRKTRRTRSTRTNPHPQRTVHLSTSRTLTKKATKRKLLRNHNNDVKLVGTEDHRCPYCLEEVVKGDKRGVVICPECSTWHHKDCWDITGSCQVAHRHKLE